MTLLAAARCGAATLPNTHNDSKGISVMEFQEFFNRLELCIWQYDLLNHPFYQAWSHGTLTRDDLGIYAQHYYHHVESFPCCLTEFARRLSRSSLQVVLDNRNDEMGYELGRSHPDLWLDFAMGVGAFRLLRENEVVPQVRNLVGFFRRFAAKGSPEEIVTAFYVYESQIPAVSNAKVRGLRKYYDLQETAYRYFTVHARIDLRHASAWHIELEKLVNSDPNSCDRALEAARRSVIALWEALDGIEHACLERLGH